MNKNTQAPEDFELESFLPYRLSLLSNTLSEGIAVAYRKPFDLSVTEWRVIAVLGRFPGLTASEIRLRTAMDKVAISRAVKRLQARGLVERSEHREDRRRAHLKLSASRGRKLFRRIVPRALEYENRLLSKLAPEDQHLLLRLVSKLQQAADSLKSPEG
ncbi:MAG: MarR family transcriptional regulator [Xanthomonadales bacterium]|nr:MarR family transcriptional regulator [Gammaproteobacteria bacterium]NNL95715.1 MarR family transcriptional regulator [Xanthomonadales bacterium]